MPPQVLTWPFLLGVAAMLIGLGVLAFVRGGAARDRSLPRSRPWIALGTVLLIASAATGYVSYSEYSTAQTWTFSYYLEVSPEDSMPSAAIVPVPLNETLLVGLHLLSGTANWSLIDTAHGRGLYLAFAGVVSIASRVPGMPRSFPPTEYAPSMAESAANTSAEVWVFSSRSVDLTVRLFIHYWHVDETGTPGWSLHTIQLAPPP